ncbi:MAG: adenylosuccinate lyase family protein, partial [Gammaproteobacteria bacterium]|nr:adenylosuccinate lyase family protein [Gemmatimonadota bacterium]NIU72133.1 adenylosuccinate lyase family protein [Gammaproteobacteria bacterium]
AQSIREHARADRLRRDVLVDETRRTGHSTLGLIRALQQMLPEHAREWVYYGATVQDLTDSWTALTAKRVGAIVRRDLLAIEA